uniref:Sema domain-containing protein n=1 Tax=Wuchereria bancrofti TaxID=6293 RepID=A0A1I8EMF1_WUCBA
MIILVLLLKAAAHMDVAKVDSFDYFELALIYPTSVCHAYGGATRFIVKKTIDNFCKVPVDAASWTIHGPQRNDGSFPQFCGSDAKKFVLSKLLPVKQKLKRYWPNFMLEKQEIIPSQEKLYDWLLLHQSLRSAYGKNVEFHCLRDKETKSWLLADVRLCLTKNFQLMDCKERPLKWKNLKRSLLLTYQPCPADGIVYLPFNNTHSVVICGTASIFRSYYSDLLISEFIFVYIYYV